MFDPIFTEGTKDELTVKIMTELIAVLVTAQIAFDTRLQVIKSPLLKVFEVNVALFVPIFDPFNFH